MDPRTHPPAPRGYEDAFVERVLEDARGAGVAIYAIAGLQGSGKTTLAHQVAALAAERGLHVVVLSIDDFYLDLPERQALARDVHPLLATRGPPGTHDVDLACQTLDALAAGEAVRLPRFDKIHDRRATGAEWVDSGYADLVLFEGWFTCVPPQPAPALAAAINALERDEDPNGTWRAYCNTALARDYPPLWRRLGRLLYLRGPDFDVVPDWRWQQEATLQAAHPQQRAMDRAQVLRFVQFFERVSRQGLATLRGIADWTVPLDAHRRPLSEERRASSPP